MCKFLKLWVLLMVYFASAATGYGQEVVEPSVGDQNIYVILHLKNGSVLEGRITASDENTITIEPSSGGEITIPRDGIKEIKQGRLAITYIENRERQYDKPPLSKGRIAGEILAGTGIGAGLGCAGGAIGYSVAHAFWSPDEHDCWVFEEFIFAAVGLSVGWILGNATGVYLVGTGGNVTGSFSEALLGSIVPGIVPLSFVPGIGLFGPAIGAAIMFNKTRRYESTSAGSGTALINVRDGQMSLAIPEVHFQPDSSGRGGLCQSVDLVKVRF